MKSKIFQVFLIILAGSILVTLSFGADTINLKSIAFLIFAGAASSFFFIPVTVAVYVLFLYLGIEGFAKLMTNYNPIIHVGSDLLILSLWFRVILGFLAQRKRLPTTYPPLTLIFALHAVWFMITVLNPYSLSLFASLAGVKLYITIFSLFFFGYYLSEDVSRVKVFMIIWIVVGSLQIVTALYQSSVGPSSVTALSPAYSLALMKFKGYAFRPFGLASQPGMPAIFVYMIIPFLFYFFFHARYMLVSILTLLIIPASMITLLICQVRSALLKAIVGATVYVIYTFKEFQHYPKRTRKIAGPFFLAAMIGFFAITPIMMNRMASNYSDNSRAIERSLSLFNYASIARAREGGLDRFFLYLKMAPFGAGLSRMGAASAKFHDLIVQNQFFAGGFFSDNLFLELLVDLGIPGVILVTLLVIGIFIAGCRGLLQMKDPQLRALQATILCSLFSILIGFFGAEPILYNPEGPFFWFFSGVLLRIPTLAKPEPITPRNSPSRLEIQTPEKHLL